MSQISPRELNRRLVYLGRKRRHFMSEQMKPYGLADPMFAFLLYLERNPGSSQDNLCEHFGIEKSTVARLAKKLELAGYIHRNVSSRDKRQYDLSLTPSGRQVTLVVHEQLNAWCDRMLDGLSEEERQTAYRLLGIMTENIRSAD